MKNYEKDFNGQWWYVYKSGRDKALERICLYCGSLFYCRAAEKRDCCTQKCTRASEPPKEMAIAKEPEQVREKYNYSKDEFGWWWYIAGGTKCRCKVKKCEQCNKYYIIAPQHFKTSRFCTRHCSSKSQPKQGEKSRRWNGGRRKNNSGYVEIWISKEERQKRNRKRQYILEHRLVMEKKLGRKLQENESIHHINGVKDDNRPENLELWVKHSTPGIRTKDVIECICCQGKGYILKEDSIG